MYAYMRYETKLLIRNDAIVLTSDQTENDEASYYLSDQIHCSLLSSLTSTAAVLVKCNTNLSVQSRYSEHINIIA